MSMHTANCPKREYNAPILAQYGDIRELTQTINTGVNGDNAGRNNHKQSGT